MGYDKEQKIKQEEAQKERAKREGHICVCSTALLTVTEKSVGLCMRCQVNLNKDD